MELKAKKYEKDERHIGKLPIKNPKICLLILHLKAFKGQRRVFYW